MVDDEDFHRLLDFMPVAIYAHVAGDIIYANPAMAKLFGAASPDEFRGKYSLDLYPAEARERARRRRDENTNRGGNDDFMRYDNIARFDGTGFTGEVAGISFPYKGKHTNFVVVREA